jgi:integrase
MKDEDIYQEWFTKKNLSKGTRRTYMVAIESYKKYTGKSLSELIDEAEEEEDKSLRMRKRKINKYIIGFKAHLEDSGLAPGSIKNKMSAVISLYQSFEIQTPQINLPKGDICLEKNYNTPPTREEIQSMINVSDARDAAIIYTMALTGLASKEIRNITVRKYLESAEKAINRDLDSIEDLFEYEDEILGEVLTLDIVREKVHYRHQTFIPPETNRAIISYIKWRHNNRNAKRHITDLDGKLFITKSGMPMSRTGVGNSIRRRGKQAGFKSKGEGAYRYWRPHSLRKYFISTIINNTGNHILADYLAGHKIDDVKRAYWHADPEALKDDYLKVLPYLSIDKAKVKDVSSKEFKTLNQKINYLEKLLADKEYAKETIKKV